MPKFVLSNLEWAGHFQIRLDKAYKEWCDKYQDELDDSRRKIFALNFFQAEKYSNEKEVSFSFVRLWFALAQGKEN